MHVESQCRRMFGLGHGYRCYRGKHHGDMCVSLITLLVLSAEVASLQHATRRHGNPADQTSGTAGG